jgi:hypothetical protein
LSEKPVFVAEELATLLEREYFLGLDFLGLERPSAIAERPPIDERIAKERLSQPTVVERTPENPRVLVPRRLMPGFQSVKKGPLITAVVAAIAIFALAFAPFPWTSLSFHEYCMRLWFFFASGALGLVLILAPIVLINRARRRRQVIKEVESALLAAREKIRSLDNLNETRSTEPQTNEAVPDPNLQIGKPMPGTKGD